MRERTFARSLLSKKAGGVYVCVKEGNSRSNSLHSSTETQWNNPSTTMCVVVSPSEKHTR